MYTSGCPKNQNRCWKRIGSPPPEGKKKEEFQLRSVSSIVIAPANTGNESKRRRAVITTDQENKDILDKIKEGLRIFNTVEIKLIAPRIEEAPARCREKIDKSTEDPGWPVESARGGYTVHPVPTPASIRLLRSKKVKEGGRSQKLRLFIRGKAISGPPNIRGISQLPKPPISTGITIKKIIINAWAVTTTLKIWSSPINAPEEDSSERMRTLKERPTIPDHIPKMKYKVPISLWLVENNHRCIIGWLI